MTAISRLALFGRPGAGKSTFAKLLINEIIARGSAAIRLRLAVPLYELQSIIHEIAGCPMVHEFQQDGELLNVLGQQLRRINPDALTNIFRLRLQQAEQECPTALIICDDMRAPDVETMVSLGFELIEISAPDLVRLSRKCKRGDLSSGADDHPTEAPISLPPWRKITNTGSLHDLRSFAEQIAREVAP